MEGNSDSAETLLRGANNENQVLLVMPNDVETFAKSENVKILENVTCDEQTLESVEDNQQAVVEDVYEDGNPFIESTSYNARAINENTVETHGFVDNAVEETNTFEENSIDETPGFVENAINETCAFEENAIDDTGGFVDNATDKTHAFEETAIDDTHSFVENAIDESSAFEEHTVGKTDAFEEHAVGKTGAFGEHTVDKTCIFGEYTVDKTYAFEEKTSDTTHAFEENTDNKAGKIVDSVNGSNDMQMFMNSETITKDVGVEHHILGEDTVEHQTFKQDVSIDDHISTQDTYEKGKTSMGKKSFEAFSVIDNSKASADINNGPQPVIEVTDGGELKAPLKKSEYDLKCYKSVTGRRSYRSDLAGPPLPAHIILAERFHSTKAPHMSRSRLGGVNEQVDSVGGKKRKLEETSVPAQLSKRKKLFPFSLFSYLSYLSPLSLLSLLRRNREDVVVEETLLTDESDDSD